MGGFYERLTVRENILFKLELSGEKQKSKKLKQVLKEFGLIDFTFYYLPVRKFSSIAFGNYQR